MATWLANLAEYFGFPLTNFDLGVLSFRIKFWCQRYARKFTKWTKGVHRRQANVAGGRGHAVPRRLTPPGHITDLRESLHTASLVLIYVGLIQRWRLSCLGSLGPPSYTWRGQTDLQTAFLTEATTIGACNRHPGATPSPLDDKAVQGTVG
jgi:hypothetical protein